jgi:hypothetical protein
MDRVTRKLRVKSLKMKRIFFLIFTILLTHGTASAENIFINGFLQGNYSAGLNESNPDGGDFKWAEEKLQLKVSADKASFYFFSKADLSYDHIDYEGDLELREAYIDYLSDYWDLRLGRQIITWGVGDLIFINDIYPKDYEAFFSGRPMEYLKIGSDAVKTGIYPSFASIEMVIIPFFEPNNFPRNSRFRMFDPVPGITNRHTDEPSTTLENTEVALRIYRNIAGFDASVYFYRGFFRQEALQPDSLVTPSRIKLFHPKLSVYGASIQGSALEGVISLEAGFYDSRQDRSGNDPMIPNQSSRFLIGYQKQFWQDFTAGIQYYAMCMLDRDQYEKSLPVGFPEEKEWQDLFTVRLTQLFMHQTLRLSFFSFWSLSDGDYMLNPEIKYNFTDHVWAAAGANIFGGGEEWNQFGSLDDNDNLYLQARYEF